MNKYRALFFLVFIMLLANSCYSDENVEQISTCEIDGIVDQNLHQLHGDLVNCQNPPMECYVDPHEYLIKSRTIIECRLLSDDLFFYDDRTCFYGMYFHRSYCFHESRCYSISMTCIPVRTPSILTWIIVSVSVLLLICIISCVSYCIYQFYQKCCKSSESQESKTTTKESLNLDEMDPLRPIEYVPKANNYNPRETLI